MLPKLTCDFCGSVFAADADAFHEGGIDMEIEINPADAWKAEGNARPLLVTFDAAEREAMMRDLGIDDAQLDQLLSTGKLKGLGMALCPRCRSEAEECPA